MGLFDDLLFKLYEPWSAQKHNAVVALAQANTVVTGPNVRAHRTPFGTALSFDAEDEGATSSSIFRATVTRSGENLAVRFGGGFIGGVKPVIGDLEIDEKGPDKKTPPLIVKPSDFDPEEGVCALYLRCTVDTSFAITRIDPVALPTKPAKEPWKAYKLTGFLTRRGSSVVYDRHLFSNLGFYAASRKANGFFDPIWFWNS